MEKTIAEKNREKTKKFRIRNIERNKNIILDPNTKKVCSHCGIEKTILEFGKHSGTKDGLNCYCKDCTNLINRDYIAVNREHVRQIKLRSYHRNKTDEEVILHRKDYRKTSKNIFSVYKYAAKSRNLPFELTLDDFIAWNGKTNCYYCGQFIPTIGIDRFDNNPLIGYKKENVVPCCGVCNQFKMDLTIEEFKQRVELIFHNFCEEK